MKQRASKKSVPAAEPPRYPRSLTAAEADSDLQEMQNLIDAASSNKTNERAARISSRNRKASNKPKDQKAPAANSIKNHDFCDACGESGQFICCDACPNVFHFTCVEPPILNVEELQDSWYCNQCEQKRSKGKRTRNTITTTIAATGGTLFKGLIDNLDGKNPKAYRLPKEIYNDFEGVSSDKYGQYVDTSTVKRVKYKNGEPILPDYHQLKTDDGKFILCYKCRKSALKQGIIKCDYCALYWHLDCLDPPMTIPPNIARKWMCPLHIEHTIKPPRKRKGAASDIANIDPNAPASAYLNYITHIIDDQPAKKQKTTPINSQMPFKEDIITSKNGTVYRLPETWFTLPFGTTKKVLQPQDRNLQPAPQQQQSIAADTRRTSIPSTSASTSSKSEANTPPTIHTSPISTHKPISEHKPLPKQTKMNDSKEETEAWLATMALFKAGHR